MANLSIRQEAIQWKLKLLLAAEIAVLELTPRMVIKESPDLANLYGAARLQIGQHPEVPVENFTPEQIEQAIKIGDAFLRRKKI